MQKLIKIFYSAAKFTPTDLQKHYVYQTYDTIAEHFDHTRFARWPKVKQFIRSIQSGSIVYDVGCGNGKYFNISDSYILGTDRSLKLLKRIKLRSGQAQLMAADAVKLPIRADSCDAVLSIAIIHHLSSKGLRMQALEQLKRILRKEGRGLVYVWCMQQMIKNKEPLPNWIYQKDKGLNKQQDMFVNWHLQDKFLQDKSKYSTQQQGKITLIKRYYHLFSQGQLQELVRSISGLEIIQSFYDKQNWCVQFRKISQ